MNRPFLTLLLVLCLALSGCRTTAETPRTLNETAASIKTGEFLNLEVPFFSQAPQGDWGAPYQEACEEASLLLAWYYVTDQNPSRAEFEADLLAMVAWEVDYFGQYEHTSIDQTATIARLYLGHEALEVATDPTVAQLREWLNQGYPVVAPFAGRFLGNPNFTGEGPVYHNLVIRGYKGSRFITNDVGTRHGKNFIYEEAVLMNALHDWDDAALVGPDGILQGAKKVLILKP